MKYMKVAFVEFAKNARSVLAGTVLFVILYAVMRLLGG